VTGCCHYVRRVFIDPTPSVTVQEKNEEASCYKNKKIESDKLMMIAFKEARYRDIFFKVILRYHI